MRTQLLGGRTRSGGAGLRVEALENRILLSCDVKVRGDRLIINGTKGADIVEIVGDSATGIDATCEDAKGNVDTEFVTRRIDRIVVKTKGGNDEILIDLAGELDDDFELEVEAGDGHDTIDVVLAVLFTDDDADLEIELEGGKGDDLIALDMVLEGEGDDVEVEIEGNKGDDEIIVAVDDSLADLDNLEIEADGGKGSDICDVSGSVASVDRDSCAAV